MVFVKSGIVSTSNKRPIAEKTSDFISVSVTVELSIISEVANILRAKIGDINHKIRAHTK